MSDETAEQLRAVSLESSAVVCLSELMRGLEIPPGAAANMKPEGFYAIGRAIAAQAKENTRADSGEAVALPVPFSIDTTHKNPAFVTLGFGDHAQREQFVNAIKSHRTQLFTQPRATSVDVRDAERYRWLRGLPRNYDGRKNGFHVTLAIAKDEPNAWFVEAARDLKLDEAIDAAIASREGMDHD